MAGSEENKKWAKEMKSPLSYKAQLLNGAKNQKKARMKGQETQTKSLQVAVDIRAAGRVLDKFKREARARPRRHQPVPSQYRTWWGHGPEVRGKGGYGLVVGRGEKIYSRLLPKPLLGGMSCWDDKPPKRGNLRGNRWVHALRVEREGINIVAGRKATRHRGIK